MDTFEDALKELAVEFVREAQDRLGVMTRLLQNLEANPRDRESLMELKRRFHGFAGSGSTYGFPRVTELGLQGERALATLDTTAAEPTRDELASFRGLVADLREVLGSPAPVEAPRTKTPFRGPSGVAPPDILVVDDDASVLALLTRTLEGEGFSVRCATSRRDAQGKIAEKLPDGLIVDILLEDGPGYSLVGEVRGRPGGESLPILVISLLNAFLDKVEAIHCGADGYFEKPLDWEALVKRLRLLLGRNRHDVGRILVVEDDPPQAGFLRAVLESAGYEVKVCSEPQAFESDLVAFAPDLVTMDVLLPGMTGYDLVRYVRQDPRYATLPVIVLTTQGQIEARVEAARSGGDEHLAKPVQPNLLLSVVAARIERARFLKSLLDRDGLTGLLTHTAFLERVKAVVSTRSRGETRQAIWVMLDVDHFKRVNDLYGHPVGDRVLVSLSALLRQRLRQSDTIGRYGGEEFAILLEGLQEVEVQRLLDRLRDEFGGLAHHAGERTFNVTFSAGFAFREPGQELDAWRDAADRALYQAKAAGRNRVIAAPRNGPVP